MEKILNNQIRLWKKGIIAHSTIRTGECFVITNINYMIAYPYCTIRYLKDGKIDNVFLNRIDEDSDLVED